LCTLADRFEPRSTEGVALGRDDSANSTPTTPEALKFMKTKALLLAAIALCSTMSALHAASEVTVAAGATKGGKLSGTNPKVFKATKRTCDGECEGDREDSER
jgi:hypothetical protein